MAYKDYYEYKDIVEATGKSYSAIKKWRISIERLSGYKFKRVKIHVTRKHVKDHYQFTEEEFEKFIKLSRRIDETKKMSESVIEIWGDLKSVEERASLLVLFMYSSWLHRVVMSLFLTSN